MAFKRILVVVLLMVLVNELNAEISAENREIEEIIAEDSAESQEVKENESEEIGQEDVTETENNQEETEHPSSVFDGVYSECLLELSYACVQRKTLLYLRELNKLKEITILGDYVKFVKLNTSDSTTEADNVNNITDTEDLTHQIDDAVNQFFNSHLLRFKALGRDVMVPETGEFVGRKRRKGGGGGGGHGGGDDGGKKKMMMMAMMCMKMKFMMVNYRMAEKPKLSNDVFAMVPAMMGMMGMMSFKTMMFSMMSFMMAKIMLLMKLLEKKGGGGGGGGGWNTGGGDGGWAASGGGAWMPAGQDYGGGYDANGQWQSRSIIETDEMTANKPIITYVKPIVRYNNKIKDPKPLISIKNLKDEVLKMGQLNNRRKKRSFRDGIINLDNANDATMESSENFEEETIEVDDNKSAEIIGRRRKKRGILDELHRAYVYWANKVLGIGYKKQPTAPKYKIVNGVKYIYQPIPQFKKIKTPKELNNNDIKQVNVEEFNEGEIVEPADSRTIKKFHKMKNKMNNVNETVEENPWE